MTEARPDIISAVELGCAARSQPLYQILDSEIDVLDQDIIWRFGGPAIYVTGCGEQNRGADVLMRKSRVKISEPGIIHNDTVFLFDDSTPLSPKLNIFGRLKLQPWFRSMAAKLILQPS